MVDISQTLALFMELQTLGDRTLRNLAFTHVVHSIRKMNKKHKNEAKNRALQNILFVMLQVCNLLLASIMIYLCAFVCLHYCVIFLCSLSKMMKPERREHLSRYASFIEGRCGSMIELQIQFVWHVFIHHQG